MHDFWWDDYKYVPNESNVEEYFIAIGLLQTLSRFGVVEVHPCYRSAPYDTIDIWIDNKHYNEKLSVFTSRFKKA